MQKIEAIIKEDAFNSIKNALEEGGFISMTVCNVIGRGKQKGLALKWRSSEHRVEFLPKVKIELVVDDKDLDRALDIICTIANTGSVGDGKIFVIPVGEVIRIRTGERGATAI